MINRIILSLIVTNIIAIVMCDYISSSKTNYPQQRKDIEELDVFVLRLMDTCKANLSETRRIVLSKQIAHAAEEQVWSRDEMESFVLLLCIESKFQSSVKSKAGAIGMAQLMPKYAEEFAVNCGYGKVSPEDLLDAEVNLHIGACQFRTLLHTYKGNVGLALAAYNSGEFSLTTRKAAALQEINPETSGYLAKFLVLQQSIHTNNVK